MPVYGVDLSDFDRGRGPVDVAAMARDGIQFLTHKATEGTKVTHAYYGQTLNQARIDGIPFLGAYMVPRTPGNNGHGSIQAQVNYFLAYLDAATPWWRAMPTFFLQVDTEHWGYDDVDPQYGTEACRLLRAQAGKWVVHYAPRWAYGDTIGGPDPLWASSYGTNPAVPYRQAYPGDGSSGWAPYSGRTPTFLQYGSKVTIGSQSGCDINAYRGTVDDLRALITGASTSATTTPQEEEDPMQVTVAAGYTHDRDTAGKNVRPADWSKETKLITPAYGLNPGWHTDKKAFLGLAVSDAPVDLAVIFGDGKGWVHAQVVHLDPNTPGRTWVEFPPAASGEAYVVSIGRIHLPGSDPRSETAPVTAIVEVVKK